MVDAVCAEDAEWKHRLTNAGVIIKSNSAAAVSVAVIDGPYDATALSGILALAPVELGNGNCKLNPNSACDHGTFIMGLLGARRDAKYPGLCAESRLLHIPLFLDERGPWASVGELANAITAAVKAGARLINLSLAILGDNSKHHAGLASALDYAEASGAVVVVAAGNQRRLAIGQLLSHPVTIPVVAVDAAHRVLPDCNFGPTISRRGVAAFGHQVCGYAPGGTTTAMSGTRVATAVATGILAELWSARPDTGGADIRAAVALLPRNGSIPPMLDPATFLGALEQRRPGAVAAALVSGHAASNYASLQGELVMKGVDRQTINGGTASAASSASIVTPAMGPSECACGAPGGVCTCSGNHRSRSGFVYAIGTVEIEYPSMAIEREMQALGKGIPPSSTDDREWQYNVLRDKKKSRYLARQLSWRLRIENKPRFVLKPNDPDGFDDLIDCLEPPEEDPKPPSSRNKRGSRVKTASVEPPPQQDLHVIVGIQGSETPDGMTEVVVDQVFSIEHPQLGDIPGLGGFLEQLSDSEGLEDTDRAYNYLAARYTIPRETLAEITKEFELASVPAIHSRLSGDKGRIVRVIFTFKSKSANRPAERKYFVRVDVTEEFPFIVTPWQQYLERGEKS